MELETGFYIVLAIMVAATIVAVVRAKTRKGYTGSSGRSRRGSSSNDSGWPDCDGDGDSSCD